MPNRDESTETPREKPSKKAGKRNGHRRERPAGEDLTTDEGRRRRAEAEAQAEADKIHERDKQLAAARKSKLEADQSAQATDVFVEHEKTRPMRVPLSNDLLRRLAIAPAMFRNRRTVKAGREFLELAKEVEAALEGVPETETFTERVRVDQTFPETDMSQRDAAEGSGAAA